MPLRLTALTALTSLADRGDGAGTTTSPVLTFDRGKPALEPALDCVKAAATTLALPRPPAGSWAAVRVPLVAP